MMKSSALFNCVPRPSPIFCTLPPSCIILNANQRTKKKRGSPGTRLAWCHHISELWKEPLWCPYQGYWVDTAGCIGVICKKCSVILYYLSSTHSASLIKINSSLIPRSPPPPVFDRLQYVKTEGEGLRFLIMWSAVQVSHVVLSVEPCYREDQLYILY